MSPAQKRWGLTPAKQLCHPPGGHPTTKAALGLSGHPRQKLQAAGAPGFKPFPARALPVLGTGNAEEGTIPGGRRGGCCCGHVAGLRAALRCAARGGSRNFPAGIEGFTQMFI